jgi:lysophospholipase L1-like esterase
MNPYISSILIGLSTIVLAVMAALLYETRQVRKLPEGNPAEFRRRGRTSPDQRVVVCLGASIVHGAVSVNFMEALRRQFPAGDYIFVNAGVNGDLAYNALRRLDSVIACDPDFVVILVGTNDVQSTLSQRTMRLAMRSKNLPCVPTIEWYRENLQQIVAQLQQNTRATIALASLPILGEDLSSAANERVREFNKIIQHVADEHSVAYLPVHERQVAFLTKLRGMRGRPFTGDPSLVIAAGIQHYLLRLSLDAISQRNGLVLTTDLMHMNSQGAAIIAEQVEALLQVRPENRRKTESCI